MLNTQLEPSDSFGGHTPIEIAYEEGADPDSLIAAIGRSIESIEASVENSPILSEGRTR